MNSLDLDDSALCSLSVNQKRKATVGISLRKSKQAKLDYDINPENSEQKLLGESSKLNESTSSYFKRKRSNMCPLCLKEILSEGGFMMHTKSCAKKHNMTTQELLKALDLQKKHMEERKELGLPSQVVPSSKKKKLKKGEKNLDSYDVALGIALSKSLEDRKATEKGKATLEEFGFKTTQVSVGTGHSSRRNKLLKKSLLKVRTAEERQRIITEKVALLLLDEDEDDEKKATEKADLNEVLGGAANEVPHLWNLGENEEKFDWYVTEIKPLIDIQEKKVPETCREDKTPSPSFPEDVENAVSQLNLPNENLSMDWRKMINNSKMSDLVGKTKDSHIVYLHSLVLQARCANILEKDYKSVFEKFNLLTVLVFLEFLYCGTLNTLTGPEVKNLSLLAGEFDYEELIKVLNCLKSEEHERNPQGEIIVTETNPELVYPDDKDAFEENMVDLTQSSHSSNDEKFSGDESNIEKSYWSFIQQEKKREEELRKEDEKEISLLCIEREKIDTNVKQRDEEMQKMMESEEESDFRDSLELQKICESQRTPSPVLPFKENTSDCIILSSDSETRCSKPEMESPDLKIPSPPNLDYEVPGFDPYDDIIASSALSPVNSYSESLLSGGIFRESPQPLEYQPEYCSTPVANRKKSTVKSSSKKPLVKKRSNLAASRIIRKSLHLQQKNKTPISVKRNPPKRKSIRGKKSVEVLSNSVLHDLSKSFTCQSSPPKSLKKFVEVTPLPGRDEFGDSVTPSPNYSKMGDSMIKEHLSRYGLKRSMGKSKAKKILRHIYEELHPRINTETGKIVRVIPNNTPTKKKTKTKKKDKKVAKEKAGEEKATSGNSSEESLKTLNESFDRSMHDSNGSEFEDLNEPLTQSSPSNPVDLPSAFREYIENNTEFYTKILMYEPIWLEDLQSELKEKFKKHFKLSDLMNYLDQKCITFRTQAQKKVNQKRAEKKRSPRKKTSR